ncbi:PAS domain S-box [Cylindrospermum stagnale PCC 7417]|uniref:histidine kinase n=1 Tax=Cylindrospermum stagnale PCC 7417 TaxID=56107 RepID=K9WVA8_9NOST|nr:HAMP domain-containing sensor histidine kinase [Cylindrospermum stagnale]AFZ24128.1 PAS domain S-box [Cylindrospermum stagnale PCC 7417]
MNSGDYTLVQSNSQLAQQPDVELTFADFLINQAVDSAFCLEENARFIYVNDATCQMTKYSREELLSMTLADIDIDFSLQDWSEKWRVLVTSKTRNSLTFKSRCRTKGGRIFLVEIAITYVKDQGREFSCAFARDKSDSELRANFVSTVCHQFRTPLNIVSFSNSLLKRHIDEWTEDKIKPLLDHIQTAVEQLSQMLDDILFLAKAEAIKLNFEPKPLDLVQFCDDLLAQMRMSTSHNFIKFVNLGNCLIASIDKKLLEPILNNLLDNAIKYSPLGSVIELKLACEDGKIIFQVKDTGIGIPPVDQQRLFEPFYRGSNIAHIPGTGLGLSIVKNLVDLHGGQIMVVSEVGVGTTFTVMLPSVKLPFTGSET